MVSSTDLRRWTLETAIRSGHSVALSIVKQLRENAEFTRLVLVNIIKNFGAYKNVDAAHITQYSMLLLAKSTDVDLICTTMHRILESSEVFLLFKHLLYVVIAYRPRKL